MQALAITPAELIDNNSDLFTTSGMKQKTYAWIVVFAALFSVMLVVTACKKATPTALSSAAQSTTPLSPKELKQQRLEWNMKTLVEPYQKAGHSDSKWDAFAISALTEFARVRSDVLATNESWREIIATNTAAAVRAGCDDPMLRYLFIKNALRVCLNSQFLNEC